MFKLMCKAFGVVALAALVGNAMAASDSDVKNWPNRTVRLVVTFPPGGSSDALGRILAKRLSEVYGQPFIVENKAGAGGAIGTAYGAKAEPDGYTFVIAAGGSLVVKPLLQPQSYDTLRDLLPVAQLVTSPFALAINKAAVPGVNSVAQLVARGKQTKGSLSFGSQGNGTQGHLAGELFNLQTGSRMVHVPYKGAGPAVLELLGGAVPAVVVDLASLVPSLGSDRIQLLAVSSKKRSSIAPSVPSATEEGIPDWVASGWIGLLAPAKTPQGIVAKLERDVNKVLHEDAIASQIITTGNEPAPSTSKEFHRFISDEMLRWKKVIDTVGIQGD